MPPESRQTGVSPKPRSPTTSSSASTFAAVSAAGRPAMRGPKPTLPATVSHSKSAPCWNTMPRSAPGPVTAFPPTVTVPRVGRRKPATMFKSVVLPQPDGPSTATISPAPIVSETRSSACTLPPSGSA